MTVKPEIYPRCWCGGEVFIAEGQDEGYCFNENCYSIVRRTTAILVQHTPMTPSEIKTARKALGFSANGLAEALRLGKGGGRTVRRWEAGDTPISGPATVAIELLLKSNN